MTTTTTTMLEPGSYSTGTLRDEDMADMFDTIGAITGCDYLRRYVSCLEGEIIDRDDTDSGLVNYDAAEAIGWSLEALFDHVEESHCPEGFYFGSIEGDGADFGIFPVEEATT